MAATRDDVLAAAVAQFGQARLAEVLALLDTYGTEPHEAEVNRVKLAVLQLSDGQIDKLSRWVDTAKLDYRDALAAQELGPLPVQHGLRLRAMAQLLIGRWGKRSGRAAPMRRRSARC